MHTSLITYLNRNVAAEYSLGQCGSTVSLLLAKKPFLPLLFKTNIKSPLAFTVLIHK
jgi:hypothetical protein